MSFTSVDVKWWYQLHASLLGIVLAREMFVDGDQNCVHKDDIV